MQRHTNLVSYRDLHLDRDEPCAVAHTVPRPVLCLRYTQYSQCRFNAVLHSLSFVFRHTPLSPSSRRISGARSSKNETPVMVRLNQYPGNFIPVALWMLGLDGSREKKSVPRFA